MPAAQARPESPRDRTQRYLYGIETRVTIDFFGNFHNREIGGNQASTRLPKPNRPRNRIARNARSTALRGKCTNSGHPLVDWLHSIACKRDKSGHFLLTIKMKGVKTTSFFDTF